MSSPLPECHIDGAVNKFVPCADAATTQLSNAVHCRQYYRRANRQHLVYSPQVDFSTVFRHIAPKKMKFGAEARADR